MRICNADLIKAPAASMTKSAPDALGASARTFSACGDVWSQAGARDWRMLFAAVVVR